MSTEPVTLKNGLTMAQIGPSKGTKPENTACDFLEANGLSCVRNFRVHGFSVDLWIPGTMTAVMIDGRFWHDPAYAGTRQRPHHKVDWVAKATRNAARDALCNVELRKHGIKVVRVWDSDLKGHKRTGATLQGLLASVTEPWLPIAIPYGDEP